MNGLSANRKNKSSSKKSRTSPQHRGKVFRNGTKRPTPSSDEQLSIKKHKKDKR